MHRLQALQGLRHAAAVVGRHRHRADPRHAAGAGNQKSQIRARGAQAAGGEHAGAAGSPCRRRSCDCRGRPSGLCRPRPVRRRCGLRAGRRQRHGQPLLSRRARRADRRAEHGQGPAGHAAWRHAGLRAGPLAAAHFDLADRRGRRPRRRHLDDHHDRVVLRLASDGARLHAQQPAHRLLLRAQRKRQAGGEPRAAGQASAFFDGADAGVRPPERPAGGNGRFAGRLADHRVRIQGAGRHARLEPGPAGGDRHGQLRQPQRPHRSRARPGVAGAGAGPAGARPPGDGDRDDQRHAGHRAPPGTGREDGVGRWCGSAAGGGGAGGLRLAACDTLTVCKMPAVYSLSRLGRGSGSGRRIDEVKHCGMPRPALSPGPSPASGRGEQTFGKPLISSF
ncbi:hypothetical protein CBM2629_A80103 [Cupriavidus taiwanensis]|nr:hypothetical protein CBM2629_A80103 [Cupriavidus taiwanensis]